MTCILALTATATPQVSEDIRKHFSIDPDDHVQTGFQRENLRYFVTPTDERKSVLVQRLRERPSGATIVYVTLQQTAEEVAGFLAQEGFNAKAYHAGLPDEYRGEVQDLFMRGDVKIVVATIAFGMGIDKADIRYVYHYNLPKSLENYAQETGRAGRDGEEGICEILACADDQIVLENFVYGDTPTPQALKQAVEHLLLQGEEFSVSRYEISGTKDIRPLVVATILTELELTGLLIPKGPFYANYRFQFVQPMEKILAGHTPDRQSFLRELFGVAKQGRVWRTIEIDAAAVKIGESSERIRKALTYLEELGDLRIQPSGLRHGYELNRDDPRKVAEITEELQELFARRELGEISRLGEVIELCEMPGCLPQFLVGHFGEKMEPCGVCGNCLANETKRKTLPCTIEGEVSVDDVALIRALVEEKHASLRQPRQLARFLCGITSPAASRARLSRHDSFGALQSVPFLAVLAQVETMSL